MLKRIVTKIQQIIKRKELHDQCLNESAEGPIHTHTHTHSHIYRLISKFELHIPEDLFLLRRLAVEGPVVKRCTEPFYFETVHMPIAHMLLEK